MLRASIDIGSNTILLLIGKVNENSFEELENHSRVTSLGKELDKNKFFHPQSIQDSFEAFRDYKKIIEKYKIKPYEVVVTATEASRVAEDSVEFFERVEEEFGFKTCLISPKGEAHYVALGVVRGRQLKGKENFIIVDIGGASTEFIKVGVRPFIVKEMLSFPIGSVRSAFWLEKEGGEEKVEEILSTPELNEYCTDSLICVAGSMTSLGGMIKGFSSFENRRVEGMKIEFSEFSKFVSQIINLDPHVLRRQYPFLGKRSQSISIGARLGLAIGKRLGIKVFEISTLGLRYGTLFEGMIEEEFLEKSI